MLRFILKKKKENNQEKIEKRIMMRHTFPRSIKVASNVKLEASD